MSIGQPEANPARRKRMLIVLVVIFLIIGLSWGIRWYVHGRNHATTDDAYVTGNLIRVTPRIDGTVVEVLVDNTDHVTQGQVLVRLDDTDARLALQQAEADLAETVRQVSRAFEDRSQQAAYLAVQQHAYDRAEADLRRRSGVAAADVVSIEETEHARAARDQARAALELARAQLAAADAIVSGTSVATHPAVLQAETRLRSAWLNLGRCVIRAPEDGQIEKRSVQLGQQITAGNPLMALVPMTQLWVEANFKEDQLKGMAVGQPVKLVSDLYGRDTVFHGTVAGLSPGTGSVFSLLPAQNASGNWIKIVQRVPVRIALDPDELARHPLRVGLSMDVEVAIGTSAGQERPPSAGYTTPVYQDDLSGADERIRAIVAANQSNKG